MTMKKQEGTELPVDETRAVSRSHMTTCLLYHTALHIEALWE